MSMRRFDLLDIARFAKPSLVQLDVVMTASELREALASRAFMSYAPLWSRLDRSARGLLTEKMIASLWKQKALIEAMLILNAELRGKGNWYGFGTKPRRVLGLEFKPIVRGVLVTGGRLEASVFNPRKGQPLSEYEVRFLARGAYEEHCISDPSNPVPVVWDLSEKVKGGGRRLVIHRNMIETMVSLDEFEMVVGRFFEAANLAGIPTSYGDGDFTADLFRRP